MAESGAVHDEREIAAMLEVLQTTTLDLGPKVDEFEEEVARPRPTAPDAGQPPEEGL